LKITVAGFEFPVLSRPKPIGAASVTRALLAATSLIVIPEVILFVSVYREGGGDNNDAAAAAALFFCFTVFPILALAALCIGLFVHSRIK
jgi:hypothetical protein